MEACAKMCEEMRKYAENAQDICGTPARARQTKRLRCSSVGCGPCHFRTLHGAHGAHMTALETHIPLQAMQLHAFLSLANHHPLLLEP